MSTGDEIFENVFNAMQDAEEIWGVEGKEYLDLMERISNEAQGRIDTFKRAIGLTAPYLAEIIKDGVLRDVRRGTIPQGAGSFSELHDYVDANCYGGLCERHYDVLVEVCGSEEAAIALVNEAQTEVDRWIKDGGMLRQIQAEEDEG